MLKIAFYKNGRGGFVASIENESGTELWLNSPGEFKTAKAACDYASKMLREAAVRFDRLAQERSPTKEHVQDKINGEPVP